MSKVNIREFGTGSYAATFEPSSVKPLDARQLVPNMPALLNTSSFPYAYKGMIVAVADIGKLYADLTDDEKKAKYSVTENEGTGNETTVQYSLYAQDEKGYAYNAQTDEYVEAGKGAVYLLKSKTNMSTLSGWQLVGESDSTIGSLSDLETLLTQMGGKFLIKEKVGYDQWTADGNKIYLNYNKFGKINKNGKSVDVDSTMGFEIPLASSPSVSNRAGVISAQDKGYLDDLWSDKPVSINDSELDILCAEAELEFNSYNKQTLSIDAGRKALYASEGVFKINVGYLKLSGETVTVHTGDEVSIDATAGHNLVIYEIEEESDVKYAYMRKKISYLWTLAENTLLNHSDEDGGYHYTEASNLTGNEQVVRPLLYDTVSYNAHLYYIHAFVQGSSLVARMTMIS